MLKFSFPGPMNVSYHNHSDFSDGAASIETMCRTAKTLGLREFGMSDHWVRPPVSGTDWDRWGMNPEKLETYVNRLLALKKELDDDSFTLRLGLEVDYFPENWQEVIRELKQYPFDYLIGSVHYSGVFSVDYNRSTWEPLTEAQKDEICEIYWKKLEGAAECGAYTFLGHLDLPKKFALIDNTKYYPHAVRVLDAAQRTGTAIELNTAGWFKDCREQYPCLTMLREAWQRHIPVVVNSDAHDAKHITRNFAEAAAVLKEAGYIQ